MSKKKTRRTKVRFPPIKFSFYFENTKYHEFISFSGQIVLKPKCGVNQYLFYSRAQTKDIIAPFKSSTSDTHRCTRCRVLNVQ